MKKINKEAINKRVQQMIELRESYINSGAIDNLHVKLQKGNKKTGVNCWTVSLIPIADCGKNCKECSKDCYDIKNVCWMPNVQIDRARNSAIHKHNIARYWNEIDIQIKANFITELRINVGGDLTLQDFYYIKKIAEEDPKTMILFFTKAYEDLNKFLDETKFPSNVKKLFSAWKDTPMDNPHNVPVSHVLWDDGSTTAPSYGAVFCKGNCSECAFKGDGCWNLKEGEHVIFKAH